MSASGIEALVPDGKAALAKLTDGTGLGNDFLGWVKLPTETSDELRANEFERASITAFAPR